MAANDFCCGGWTVDGVVGLANQHRRGPALAEKGEEVTPARRGFDAAADLQLEQLAERQGKRRIALYYADLEHGLTSGALLHHQDDRAVRFVQCPLL